MKVVNLKHEKFDVYIGRRFKRGKHNFEESIFNNPYSLREFNNDRKGCLDAYYRYFYHKIANDKNFKSEVLKLHDKTLGCWCKPLSCHGDIIKNYLDMIDSDERDTI